MSNEGNSNYRWYHINQVPQFVVSLLTLIAVGIYTCYSRQQVAESENANAIARAALTEANKPFVSRATLNETMNQDANGNHRRIGLVWQNFGNTPALSVTVYVCSPLIRNDENPPAEYKCNLDYRPEHLGAIPAKQNVSLTGPIISEEDLKATQESPPKKAIYLFGYIAYGDSVSFDRYGNPLRRATGTCVRVIQSKFSLPPSAPANLSLNIPVGVEAPLVGQGCPGFKYCIDAECDLPKIQ